MSVIFVRTVFVIAAASLFIGVATPQERSAEDVIKGRQSNLHDLGAAYKSLTDELKKSKPVPVLVQQYIGQIGQLAKQREYWFPRGTGPEAGIDTKAKALIWTNPEDFSRRMQVLGSEAEKLVALENSSNTASIVDQLRALGESCKSCHDKYREPED
jgi:cytochrome c556